MKAPWAQPAPHRVFRAKRRPDYVVAFTLIELRIAVAAHRQWYVGGRIPILREPEKFRVAPASADDTEAKE